MSPIELLRWATEPVERRSTALLWGGLIALLASSGVLTSMEAPPLAEALLYLVMISGWTVGACGMVGYMRWFFKKSSDEARKSQPPPQRK
ncbi:MAG: hypothetical protein FJY54_12180 [Betaproteobacteria bacterium]|nr:hypothetical protein [Betaproteobacteria bacterium]